ncbi:recombinase family protein [Acidithiobacillus thiooxidans]|uniref:recombinase family protein n=1 Tax=Acidithiobacillus thiooxidans TaxID=930 RepID=UPI0009DA6591
MQDSILTLAELETLGVAFVVLGHIDMRTPMGYMMAHLLSAVAEFEREFIREHVRSGLVNATPKKRAWVAPARSRGKWTRACL